MSMSRIRKCKKLLLLIGIGSIVVGVWWWIWRAPYRTLNIFIDALYTGDIETLYRLTPIHEQQEVITPELIRHTYHQFLKPLLDKRFPRDRLVRIQRERCVSTQPPEVLFYLWFQGEQYPLDVYLCCPPDGQGWRVLFSYFVWLTAKTVYGNPTPIMRQLGYEKVATASGGAFWLQ